MDIQHGGVPLTIAFVWIQSHQISRPTEAEQSYGRNHPMERQGRKYLGELVGISDHRRDKVPCVLAAGIGGIAVPLVRMCRWLRL